MVADADMPASMNDLSPATRDGSASAVLLKSRESPGGPSLASMRDELAKLEMFSLINHTIKLSLTPGCARPLLESIPWNVSELAHREHTKRVVLCCIPFEAHLTRW